MLEGLTELTGIKIKIKVVVLMVFKLNLGGSTQGKTWVTDQEGQPVSMEG